MLETEFGDKATGRGDQLPDLGATVARVRDLKFLAFGARSGCAGALHGVGLTGPQLGAFRPAEICDGLTRERAVPLDSRDYAQLPDGRRNCPVSDIALRVGALVEVSARLICEPELDEGLSDIAGDDHP